MLVLLFMAFDSMNHDTLLKKLHIYGLKVLSMTGLKVISEIDISSLV